MEVKAKLNEIQGILTSLDSELISDEDPLKINQLLDFMNKNLYQYNPVAVRLWKVVPERRFLPVR